MKCGPFAMWPAFPTPDYYDPLRLPLGRPHHFPGSPVIGGHRFPPPRRRRGRDGSPGFPGRPSARSTPNTPEGSSAPAPGPRALSVAFAVDEPARLPLPPASRQDSVTTLVRASLALQTARSIPPRFAPGLSATHGGITHYQGPRHLPGPDSHRQAAPNLSLLRHVDLHFLMAPEQSRRTRPPQQHADARTGEPRQL